LYVNKQLHVTSEDSNRSRLIKISIILVFLLCIQLLILIFWTGFYHQMSGIVITDKILNIGEYQCLYRSKHDNGAPLWVWLSLELIYFSILLAYGLGVVFHTWKIGNSESKYLLISLYNIIIGLIIGIALAATLSLTERIIFIISSVMILFITTSTIFFVCLPRLLGLLWNRARSFVTTNKKPSVSDTSRSQKP